MHKDWIVVLGAGAEQEPIYREAQIMGFYTAGFDQNSKAPARHSATSFYTVSSFDHEKIIKVLKEEGIQPSGVITLGSDVAVSISKIQKEYKLPGNPPIVAERLTNKILMKQAFVKENVPSPSFKIIQRNDNFFRNAVNLGEKIIVKPIDGRGSRGVQQVNSRESYSLIKAVELAFEASRETQILIEEFVEGPQFSVEGIFVESKFINLVTSERNYSRIGQFGMHIIEDGGEIQAQESPSMTKEVEDLVTRAAKSLGVKNGTIKGDLVRAPNGKLMVIEIAGRLSGGWLASHQIPASRGIPLLKLAILNAIGHSIKLTEVQAKTSNALAVRYWFTKPGVVKSINGINRLEQLEGLIKFGFFREVGDYQPEISSHADRFGFVIFCGNTSKEAVERCIEGLKTVKIEIAELN